MALPFLLISVSDKEGAKAFVLSAKCTPCMRRSYSGVKWVVDGEIKTLRWADL